MCVFSVDWLIDRYDRKFLCDNFIAHAQELVPYDSRLIIFWFHADFYGGRSPIISDQSTGTASARSLTYGSWFARRWDPIPHRRSRSSWAQASGSCAGRRPVRTSLRCEDLSWLHDRGPLAQPVGKYVCVCEAPVVCVEGPKILFIKFFFIAVRLRENSFFRVSLRIRAAAQGTALWQRYIGRCTRGGTHRSGG